MDRQKTADCIILHALPEPRERKLKEWEELSDKMSPNKSVKLNRAGSMATAASEGSVSSTDESNAAAAGKVHSAGPMCPHVGKAVNIKGVRKTLGVAWYGCGDDQCL